MVSFGMIFFLVLLATPFVAPFSYSGCYFSFSFSFSFSFYYCYCYYCYSVIVIVL